MPSCCGCGQFCDFPWCDCDGNAKFRASHGMTQREDEAKDCGEPWCNYCRQLIRPKTERHPKCVFPICGCIGTVECKADPMNTPMPCDVTVGATTFRKGVKLGTFVAAAQRWHREAFPDFYALTNEQKAANLARLQGAAGVRPSSNDQPKEPT